MTKTVTLLDVARAAGVSKSTAANVFNRPFRVRPAVIASVEAAARELGYGGPDPKGRMLSSGRVNAIGVVPFGNFGISVFFKYAYARDFLAGISAVCEERGVGLSLVSGTSDPNGWGVKNALVDGFIFNTLEQAGLIGPHRQRGLPFVLMDVDGGPTISSVRIENRDGARQAVRHLTALGHRRFAIGSVLWSLQRPVFHPPSKTERQLVSPSPSFQERLSGVADALAEVGISINEVPLAEACGTPEEEAAFGNGAGMLLDRAPEATAVIALTDSLALAILKQAKKRGISVPRNLSIVGFDDIPDAALADPPLTTVHQSGFENGQAAARLLLDRGPPRQVFVPVKLVVRASTAPPLY